MYLDSVFPVCTVVLFVLLDVISNLDVELTKLGWYDALDSTGVLGHCEYCITSDFDGIQVLMACFIPVSDISSLYWMRK